MPVEPDYGRGLINLLLGRRKSEALPADLRIWVAGCGTLQATIAALTFPNATILATDIARESLAVAGRLIESLGINNVELRLQSLLAGEEEQEFDLVLCTGVLHHLAQPGEGLKRIRAALRPNGCAELFVYNAMHRLPYQRFQKVHRQLLGAGGGSGDHEQERWLAEELLDFIKSSQLDPAWSDSLEWLRDKPSRSCFADTLLHPRESAFHLAELLSELERAGLRLASWSYPQEWDLARYLGNHPLTERIKGLSQEVCWIVLYNLAGSRSPYFRFFAERDDTPRRSSLSQEDLLECRPILSTFAEYVLEEHQLNPPEFKEAWEERDGYLLLRSNSQPGPEAPLMRRTAPAVPMAAQDLLLACDGESTVASLLDRFDPQYERQEMIALFEALLSPQWLTLSSR